MIYNLRFFCLFVVLLSLSVAGCSSKGLPGTVPVSGVLLFEDGKPVGGASIRFIPEAEGGREANGYTGKDGDFFLSSYKQADGALPGNYVVVVTKTAPTLAEAPAAATPEDQAKAMKGAWEKGKAAPKTVPDPVPAIYNSAKSTPLKWRVEPGDKNKVELKVKRS